VKVSEVMTARPECIAPTATVQEAAGRMKSLDVGSLPVCDNDRLVGVITDRDIALRSAAAGHDPTRDHVRDTMSPGIIYCFDDQDAKEAAEIMGEKQIRRLPVLDRNKRLVGIVSLGDLAVETRDDKMSGDALKHISEHTDGWR
jgi:CBS domain-containing protein